MLNGLHLGVLRLSGRIAQSAGLGTQRLTWGIGRMFPGDNRTVVPIGTQSKMQIALNDGYWTQLLFGVPYEPEVQRMLGTLLSPEVAFVDCGANLGYWSIIASETTTHVMAIEATPTTFRDLEENCSLNSNRFSVLHAAVWSHADTTLNLVAHQRRHAGNSVVQRQDRLGESGYTKFEVPTVSLDSLIHGRPTVIKLDIEGAEIPVIESSKELLMKRPVALIYEDHGADQSCEVTATILDMGMHVFRDSPTDLVAVQSWEDVQSQKSNPSKGYNFLALSPEWPTKPD